MKNHKNSWWGRASAGNGQEICASAPAFCKKPSKCPHDGGTGRLRPPRSLKTGSITIPCSAWPGPAVATWMTYGAIPMPKPVSRRETRERSIPRTSAIEEIPTPSTRSSRNNTASPRSNPAARAQRSALRSSSLLAARASIPQASPHTARPTPPTHANAVSPNGMMMSAEVTAAPTASTRPHRRASA